MGRHVAALDPSVVDQVAKARSHRAIHLQLFYRPSKACNTMLVWTRLYNEAILCLYGRVITTKQYRYAIYTIGSIIVLACISCLIVAIAICQPFAYFWDLSIPNGHCGNIPAAYRYLSVPNLLTDVCILILPLHCVWNLHTKVIHKIGLTLTFLTGCL